MKTTKRKNEKMIRKTRNIITFISICFVMGCVLGSVISYVQILHREKTDYENYLYKLDTINDKIDEQEKCIKYIQQEKDELETSLYKSFNEYNQSFAKDESNSETVIFRRMFQEIYPSEKEFLIHRKDSLIVIYVLLDRHPEIQEYGNIGDTINSINDNKTKLDDGIEVYNDYVDDYNYYRDKINTCDYVLKHLECKIYSEPLKPIVFE